MKNIHILPTDKPSRLFEILQFNFVFDNQNKYSEEYKKLHSYKNQNIYITSDEEIKEGDCFLPQGHINPHKLKEYNKINGDLESYNGLCYDISKCKKIILTTDADLIKEGVQAIDDEFLEWFVKNPSCEEVEVKSLKTIPALQLTGNNHCMYQLIIPKEELKQENTAEYIDRHIVEAMVEVAKQKLYSEEEVLDVLRTFLYNLQIGEDVEDVNLWFEQYYNKTFNK